VRFANVLIINCWPNTSVKCHKRRNKAIKILNTTIPTDPYKMAIFPGGIPYTLQNSKNPYCRYFSLRVATLRWKEAQTVTASLRNFPLTWRNTQIQMYWLWKRLESCNKCTFSTLKDKCLFNLLFWIPNSFSTFHDYGREGTASCRHAVNVARGRPTGSIPQIFRK